MAFFSFLDQKKKKDALRKIAKERKKAISLETAKKADEGIHLRLLQSPFFFGSKQYFLLRQCGRGGGHKSNFGNGAANGEKSLCTSLHSRKRASDGCCGNP